MIAHIRKTFLGVFAYSLFAGFFLFSLGILNAEHAHSGVVPENVNIKITDDGIQPAAIKLTPGTTVIWVNEVGSPVKVRFLSKAVATTCKAPRGFVPDSKGIYQSTSIIGGGIASLCFLERNIYEYEVDVFEPQKDDEIKAGESVVVRKLLGKLSVD